MNSVPRSRNERDSLVASVVFALARVTNFRDDNKPSVFHLFDVSIALEHCATVHCVNRFARTQSHARGSRSTRTSQRQIQQKHVFCALSVSLVNGVRESIEAKLIHHQRDIVGCQLQVTSPNTCEEAPACFAFKISKGLRFSLRLFFQHVAKFITPQDGSAE